MKLIFKFYTLKFSNGNLFKNGANNKASSIPKSGVKHKYSLVSESRSKFQTQQWNSPRKNVIPNAKQMQNIPMIRKKTQHSMFLRRLG